MDKLNLSEILDNLMKEKGFTLERLLINTNIPKRYATALLENDLDKLPSSPYVRGYLLKIAKVLNEDPEILLRAYKELASKRPDKNDILPINRYAFKKTKINWQKIAIILILGFLGFLWINHFFGAPRIKINLEENITSTNSQILTIQGLINPRDSLSINEENIFISPEGEFEKEVILQKGLNTFEIKAKRFLGRETKIIRQVFYSEP